MKIHRTDKQGCGLTPTDLERLVWLINTAKGFALVFVKANTAKARAAIVDQLGSQLHGQITYLQAEPEHGSIVRQFSKASEKAAVHEPLIISIPESFVLYRAKERPEREVLDLNLKRNVFVRSNRPVIFLLSFADLTTLAERAPDLYDFRSITLEAIESETGRFTQLDPGAVNVDLDSVSIDAAEEYLSFIRNRLEDARRGPGAPRSVVVPLAELARVYRRRGHLERALEAGMELEMLTLKLYGPESRQAVTAISNVATTLSAMGKHEDALKYREKAASISKRTLPAQDTELYAALGNLARTYSALGRSDEALKLQEQVASESRRFLGEEHPDTIVAVGNLARERLLRGDFVEAAQLGEEALRHFRNRYGDAHRDTLVAISNLADAYSQIGRT